MSTVERELLLGKRGGHAHSHSQSHRGRLLEEEVTPSLLARARRHQPSFQRSIAKLPLGTRIREYMSIREGSIAIFLVLSILLLLFLSILGGLLLRPWFTFGLLMASGASLLFVLTEASAYGMWHHNREAENRFWIVVAIVLSSTVVFAPDSPLGGLGSAFPVLGVVCVMASAVRLMGRFDAVACFLFLLDPAPSLPFGSLFPRPTRGSA